uniref:Protein PIGBOS1 n=1 Tax=Electrophorus electricus TaxID=8005 RepID=A0AAY5ED04_ELEEL
MFPRRIPLNQIAFATLLGVGGGIYIYKPAFENFRKPTSEPYEQDIRSGTKGQDVDEQGNIAEETSFRRK